MATRLVVSPRFAASRSSAARACSIRRRRSRRDASAWRTAVDASASCRSTKVAASAHSLAESGRTARLRERSSE